PADADAHPQVVLGADRPADRAQPVVAALAAAELEPDLPGRDVELVVHHDQGGRLDLVELAQPGHRAARLVHVRRRLGQHGPRASGLSGASCSMPASASASASSASRASADTCAVTLTMRCSSSPTRLAPAGRVMSAAWIWLPACRPSTLTSTFSGMAVAETSS